MAEPLLIFLIFFPFLAAIGAFALSSAARRAILIGATVLLLALASFLLERNSLSSASFLFPFFGQLIVMGDFSVLLLMLFLGLRHRHPPIVLLSAGQLLLLGWLEFFVVGQEAGFPLFHVDALALVLVRVVCLVGGLICLFAIPYMAAHEAEQREKGGGLPLFFAVLLLFLGAMNGLVLTNNMLHFYFFFELTTLCSFLLIRHDKTEEARQNGLAALWMNSLGGLFLLLAIWLLYAESGTLDMGQLCQGMAAAGATLLPLSLLLVAAFVKSAQLPFQKWLLGAMVAPTPVSALLHSSTMVKAGVYLGLRFAPAFTGTILGHTITLAGGFVFCAAALLAVGQQNAKKVLAYSTISNLGLMFACAGIGTPAAMVAGIFLILFHALSKGLLFLCVGAAEQQLHSRDIEALRGLYQHMPLTALFAVIGVVTLILPPFGMLVGKWLALEAGADHVVFFLLVGLGSAFTVLYWARLGGGLMGVDAQTRDKMEKMPLLTLLPQAGLACAAVLLGFSSPLLADRLALSPGATSPGLSGVSIPGGFWPLFFAIGLIGLWSLLATRRSCREKAATPYLAGANSATPGKFVGPLRQQVSYQSGNYYLPSVFGEARLTPWLNVVAWLIVLFLLAVGVWR